MCVWSCSASRPPKHLRCMMPITDRIRHTETIFPDPLEYPDRSVCLSKKGPIFTILQKYRYDSRMSVLVFPFSFQPDLSVRVSSTQEARPRSSKEGRHTFYPVFYFRRLLSAARRRSDGVQWLRLPAQPFPARPPSSFAVRPRRDSGHSPAHLLLVEDHSGGSIARVVDVAFVEVFPVPYHELVDRHFPVRRCRRV